MKRLSVLVLVGVLILSVFLITGPVSAQHPSNAILFIGDGMAHAHVELARMYTERIYGAKLTLDQLAHRGQMTNLSTYMWGYVNGDLVTDSAAAGTAMATGIKTYDGAISVGPDGEKLTTIVGLAQNAGKSVGLVTTTRITHATPAVFAAHVEHRGMEDEIAYQMIHDYGVDFLAGGGLRHFDPDRREDGRDLLAEAEDLGYTVITDAAEFNKMRMDYEDKVLALFTDSHLSYELDRDPAKEPSLSQLVNKAIDLLSKNENGFFLMVEGGRIDHSAHQNCAATTIYDTIAMDVAVRTALDFADQNQDTLLIVTADHDTGAPHIGLNYDSPKLDIMANYKVGAEGLGALVMETDLSVEAIQEVIYENTSVEISEESALYIAENYTDDLWDFATLIAQHMNPNYLNMPWGTTQHSGNPVPGYLLNTHPDSDLGWPTGWGHLTDVFDVLIETIPAVEDDAA